MSYSEADVSEAIAAMSKHRRVEGEVGVALVVVGLSAQRVEKESRNRDDMIRVAHRSGASMRRLAEHLGSTARPSLPLWLPVLTDSVSGHT